MTRDQAQTRALARLMDLRDEGLTPGDAVNLEIMTLFTLIGGMSKNRREAEAATKVMCEAMLEGFAEMKPDQFGARRKGKR